jgi:hypothetical protein
MGRYSPLIGVIDAFQRDVFLVFKQPIKFWSQAVETQFGQNKLDVGSDQWSITYGQDHMTCVTRKQKPYHVDPRWQQS